MTNEFAVKKAKKRYGGSKRVDVQFESDRDINSRYQIIIGSYVYYGKSWEAAFKEADLKKDDPTYGDFD